jgi:hypothetical protein
MMGQSYRSWHRRPPRTKRTWVNGKFKLALLTVVGAEPLEEESTEARTSPSAERVEKEEALLSMKYGMFKTVRLKPELVAIGFDGT